MKQKFLVILLVFLGVFAQGLPALGQYQIGYKADLKQGDTLPLESLFPYEKGKGSLINVHGGFPVYLQLPKGSQNIGIHDPDIVEKRGDSLLIKKPGSARLEVDRGAYLLYISLRAELLYGSAREVATGTAPVAPKKILIREDQDLDKHIGVGAHMFVASWWSVITSSEGEDVFSDNEGKYSFSVRDLLARGNDFKLEVFDGCEGYDPHTGESYGDSRVSFEILDQRTPTPPEPVYNVTINPLQNGTIVATPNKAVAGTSIQLQVNPANGYRLQAGSLKVTNSTTRQLVPVNDDLTFIMPDSDVRVSASFEQIPPVDKPITGLSLGTEPLKLKVGSQHQLQVTITPENTTDPKQFTWHSTNPAVVEVVDGKLTAKELGMATVSVQTSNGIKAEILVIIDQSRDDEKFKLPHILGLQDRNDGAVMQLQNRNFQIFWADAQEVQKFAFLCERNDGKTERLTFERGMDQTLKLDAGQWKLTITLDAGTANEQIVTYPVIIAEEKKR